MAAGEPGPDCWRSKELLDAGLRAVALADREHADRVLTALEREGEPADYRALAVALRTEARDLGKRR